MNTPPIISGNKLVAGPGSSGLCLTSILVDSGRSFIYIYDTGIWYLKKAVFRKAGER